MAANWEGYEDIHQMCLNVTKFGNDDDLVDNIHAYITEQSQAILQKRPDPFTGLDPFLYKGAADRQGPAGRLSAPAFPLKWV